MLQLYGLPGLGDEDLLFRSMRCKKCKDGQNGEETVINLTQVHIWSLIISYFWIFKDALKVDLPPNIHQTNKIIKFSNKKLLFTTVYPSDMFQYIQ